MKKKVNKLKKKNEKKNKNNYQASYEKEEKLNNNFNEYVLKDKNKAIKNKNNEIEYLCNSKSNLIILYFKFLFEYSNILYKSYDNSKLDFNFNLDNKYKFLKKIMESKYFELIKWDPKKFKKILANDNLIFKEPKNFLLFSIQIFLNFFVAVKIITSNILNITCYNNEDLMMKYPYSQFNKNLLTFKNTENNKNNNNKDFIINKESNKVEIINFNSEQNIQNYYKYLNQSSNLLSQKNILFSRGIDDILPNKNYKKRNSENDVMETNYPNKVFSSFINNKNTHNDIKNSRYINNYPSTTLLSLKRFLGAENQTKIFNGFKSADKNKNLNNRYTKTKDSKKTIDTSAKIYHKNFSKINPLKHKKKLSQIYNKELDDIYLSKEYNYEFEIEENPNKLRKRNLLNKNKRRKHIFKYSYDDPQKQLIFSRMNDIRNLELFTNNSNNKSTSINDMGNEIQESKFYEMYDRFKQKYLHSNKINSGYKNYSRLYKLSKKDSSSITSQSYISNKNINMVKGMKFIKNNSEFFYGVKSGKNEKSRQKQRLPYIHNKSSNRQYSADYIDSGEG